MGSLNHGDKPAKKPVCGYCGSDDVKGDAYVVWNEELEQWEIENIFDNYYCVPCGVADFSIRCRKLF